MRADFLTSCRPTSSNGSRSEVCSFKYAKKIPQTNSQTLKYVFEIWPDSGMFPYTQRNLLQMLLNPTQIRLYLLFSNRFGTANEQCPFVVPNQLENDKYNLISVWFLCERFYSKILVYLLPLKDPMKPLKHIDNIVPRGSRGPSIGFPLWQETLASWAAADGKNPILVSLQFNLFATKIFNFTDTKIFMSEVTHREIGF